MSDKITNTPSREGKAPTFDFEPEQLEPFRCTGFELIELHAPGALDPRGKPIGKAPRHGWRGVAALDIDGARELLDLGVNVGVRLRETDLVVDVDPRNFESGDDPVARLERALGIRFDRWPRVDTGAGGMHFYMTVPVGFRAVDTLEGYPGIEFKAHGRQMVAPGSSHPLTGRPYRWDPLAEPVADALPAPVSLIELIRRPDPVAPTGSGECDPDAIELMLTGLDPSSFRDQSAWLELMMACHHASAGEAREEFIAWSVSDPSYADHEDIIGRRWDSLHGDDSGSRVTAKTLFKALHAAGKGDLIEQAMRADPVDDFPDDLADLPDHIGDPNQRASLLDRVNTDRFTVLTGGRYLVGRERIDPRTGLFSLEWYAPDAVKQHMNAKSVETPAGPKPLGTWWINHPQRRQYDGVLFDPTPNAQHDGMYNLWRGWAVTPRRGDWSKMRALVREVLCAGDQASYDYVMKWMAHMVQHPARPAEVAMVFKGSKGSGKGTFCRALTELAGKHGRHVTSPEHFTGRFNEHLADTIVLFVDEGFWAGDKKAEGQLKGLITEKSMSYEGKGKPIFEGPNQLHVVMASNEDWVVPATHDERRFAVFEADDSAAKAFRHFAALNDEDGPERDRMLSAMLYDLMHMELSDWHPRKDIPQTRALVDQKIEGFRKSPLDAWWFSCLENGEVNTLTGVAAHWPEGWLAGPHEKDLMLTSLHVSSKDAVSVTKTKLAKYLGKVGVSMGDKVRNSQNQKVWSVPSLQQARQSFESQIGGSIEWPD